MDNKYCDHSGFSFTKQQLAAVLSTNEGRQLLTLLSRDGVYWSDELILRADGLDGDLGYPASVELPDGEILTVYYQRLSGDDKTSVLSTRWHLPEII